jgi:hypothetical protein
MSIQASDLRKLVKIVRQYEVIYGGGISSSDAAVREDCESLVGLLESELGGRKAPERKRAQAIASLPSLIDARKRPREAGSARPMASRSSELAKLTSSKSAAKDLAPPGPVAKPEPKGKGKAKPQAKQAVETPAPSLKKTSSPIAAKKAIKGKKEPAVARKGVKPSPKAAKPEPAAPPAPEDEVYKDVRSRHVGAAKAAVERSNRIAGKADDSDEAETKKRFPALHLFDAFQQNRLPKYGGFIVCVRFSDETGYTVIEVIGYGNMQDLYPEGETLVFKSVGCKLYAIVEPAGYLLKSVEPVNRPSGQMVPYRFAELLRITTKRFQNIFVGRKPVFMPTSFSIFKPTGEDIAILFYDIADVYSNIQDFLIMILRDRLGVPVPDSRKAAEVIARGIREFRLWLDEA